MHRTVKQLQTEPGGGRIRPQLLMLARQSKDYSTKSIIQRVTREVAIIQKRKRKTLPPSIPGHHLLRRHHQGHHSQEQVILILKMKV